MYHKFLVFRLAGLKILVYGYPNQCKFSVSRKIHVSMKIMSMAKSTIYMFILRTMTFFYTDRILALKIVKI